MKHNFRAQASKNGEEITIGYDVSYEEPELGGTTTQSGSPITIPLAVASEFSWALQQALGQARINKEQVKREKIAALQSQIDELQKAP